MSAKGKPRVNGFIPRIIGARIIKVAPAEKEKMLGLLIIKKLIYRSLALGEDGGLSFTVPLYEYRLFAAECADAGIRFTSESADGLYGLFMRYRKRAGLCVGVLAMLCVISLSTRYVSDIRVSGNLAVSEAEITELLAGEGFSHGTYIPDTDFEMLHNNVLLATEKLAWIAVNMRGTVAMVEVRETLNPHDRTKPEQPANIIAARDGQIEEVCVYSGKEAVKINDVVRKGELLISGLIDGGASGVRYVAADGLVNAVTYREIVIYKPFSVQTKNYTGGVKTKTSLDVYGASVPIITPAAVRSLFYADAEEAEADVSTSREKLTLGKFSLPVSLVTETRREYSTENVTVALSMAVTDATAELKASLASLSEYADILERTDIISADDNGVTLKCELYCLENIAQSVPFEVENENNK